jgi:hypothetical protein
MSKDTNGLNKYLDQNAREVAALVEIGAMNAPTARLVNALLRERYPDLKNMAVSDRVDLARDLAQTLSADGLQ